jgi:hypothetical protein
MHVEVMYRNFDSYTISGNMSLNRRDLNMLEAPHLLKSLHLFLALWPVQWTSTLVKKINDLLAFRVQVFGRLFDLIATVWTDLSIVNGDVIYHFLNHIPQKSLQKCR